MSVQPTSDTRKPRPRISRNVTEILEARPGRKSVADDRFVKIKSKPYKRAVTLDLPNAPDPSPRDVAFVEEEIAHLPLVIRWTVIEDRRVMVWTDGRGAWWRNAGKVLITKPADGPRAFTIALYTGANEDDLKFFLKMVENARRGEFFTHGWEKLDPNTVEWINGDELSFHFTYNSREYKEPFLHRDRAPLVYPCGETLCASKYHLSTDTSHVFDKVQKTVGKHASYTIAVEKYVAKPNPDWTLDVFFDSEFSEATPAMTAEFVSDLQWMAEECRRANGSTA